MRVRWPRTIFSVRTKFGGASVMRMSGRELAAFIGVSARSIGRLEQDGMLERQRNGQFDLQRSVQRLLNHFMTRERWAFQQLRRHRIFNESWGDVFEPPHRRAHHG
jgi:DNA-binding XRE family transcriptional regulator